MPTDEEIADALGAGIVSARWRYERVTKRGTVLQDITQAVTGARFTEDYTVSVIRSATFDLIEDLISPGFDLDGAIIAATAIYRVLGQDVEFPRGVYRVSAPLYRNTASYTRVTIDGMDLKSDIIAAESSTAYVVSEGRNYVDEVRFLLDSLGYPHDIAGTDLVTPVAFTFEPFTTYGEIIDSLLRGGINYYPLFADTAGVFRSYARTAPKDAAPDVLYSAATPPYMLRADTFDRQRTEQRINNRVSVTINDPARPAAIANRENADVRSPNSTQLRGATDTYEIKGDRVASAYREKLADPATALDANALCCAFSPDGTKLAIGMASSPYLAIYDFDEASGIGTQLSGITGGLIPAGRVRGLSWNSTSDKLVIGMDASPYVRVYEVSTSVTGAIANPASLPSGECNDVAFSHDGAYIAAAVRATPWVEVWNWGGSSWGAKVTAPATAPASYGTGVAWRTGDSHLAVSHYGGQGVSIYPWSAGFGARIEPAIGAEGNAEAVAWNSDGSQLAVAIADQGRNVRAWQWNGGAPLVLSNPERNLPSYGLDVEYRPLTDDLAAAGASRYNTTIYFGNGTNLDVTSQGGVEGDRDGLAVWRMEADEFGIVSPAPSLVLQTIQGISWHPGGLLIALAHFREPYITVARFQGGNTMREIADYELSRLDTFYETATFEITLDPRRAEHETLSLEIPGVEERSRWLIHQLAYGDMAGAAMTIECGRARALDFRDFEPGADDGS